MLSTNLGYRNITEEVEKELKECEKILVSKFMNDSRVKQVAQGRNIRFIPQISMRYELESKIANKIIIEAMREDFLLIKMVSFTPASIDASLSSRGAGIGLPTTLIMKSPGLLLVAFREVRFDTRRHKISKNMEYRCGGGISARYHL